MQKPKSLTPAEYEQTLDAALRGARELNALVSSFPGLILDGMDAKLATDTASREAAQTAIAQASRPAS